ncbi:MAG: PAS domain S-box protein, partial [Bryobacteraceae bacterium]
MSEQAAGTGKLRRDRSPAVRYGGAVLLVLVAAVLRIALHPVLGPLYPFATFFISALISQWFGGFRPALLAVALGAVSANFLFLFLLIPPLGRTTIFDPTSLVGSSFYLLASLIAISLLETQKRARMLAEERLEQWRQERALRETVEAKAGAHRRQSELILASIGDAVIATDNEGRIEFLNAVAEALTGWQAEAAAGRQVEEVFRIVSEETRTTCDNPARKVLRDGRIQGLANHTILIDRGGREIPIDDSGAPIRDESGQITGVVLVFRDIGERRRAERALHQAEANYRALFHTASVGIVTCDPETRRYLQVNSRMCLITGYSEEELLQLTPENLAFPEESERAAASRDPLMQGAAAEHYVEKRYRQKDGGVVWVQVWASVISDPDGRPRMLAAVIEDITERHNAAEAIRTSEERYRSLVAATSSLVWTTDPSGAFTTPQPPWEAYTGQSWEQYRDWGWVQAVHPDDRLRVQADWSQALAKRSTYHGQGRIWHAASAQYHYYVARAAPLLDATGSVREWIGTIADIDESQRAGHARAQFAQILDLAGDGIVVMSMDGTIEFWNPGAERIYGWSPLEAAGRISSDLLRTQYPAPLEQIRNVLLSEGHWSGELVHLGRDGARIVVLSRWALRRDIDGAPAG